MNGEVKKHREEGCKITPQVTCSVMTVKEFFHSLDPIY